MSDLLTGYTLATKQAYIRINALEAENAELRKDAGRYRHLRNTGAIIASTICAGIALPLYAIVGEAEKLKLDSHIDAAIAASKQGAGNEH